MIDDSPVCCLATLSHVAQLHVFAGSLARWHGGPCYCLLIDSDDLSLLPAGLVGIRLREIIGGDDWKDRQARFTPFEAIVSLKPRLLGHVLRQTGKNCIYLDIDILVLQSFAARLVIDDGSSVLLTPHRNGPPAATGQHKDLEMLRAGAFNSGVLAVTASESGLRFLDWWDAKCHDYCLDRPRLGLFVDQRWLDLAPALFPGARICADPGINLGHWRIDTASDFSADESGLLCHAGATVALLHLSGFDPARPDRLSRHKTLEADIVSALRPCLEDYARALLAMTPAVPDTAPESVVLAAVPMSSPSSSGPAASAPDGSAANDLRPGEAPMAKGRHRHLSADFGINLIGNFSSGVGLGVITRGIAAVLKSRGLPFSIFDVPHAWGSSQPDPALAGYLVAKPEALKHPVNLYVLPTVFFETFFQANPAFQASERLHIANLWWEASHLPPRWINMLSRFDGILAMSDFIADVCRNSVPMTPTLYGEAPLELPENIRSDRKEFGLPHDAVVFAASLDPNSDPERKNPAALVTAFRAAFPAADHDVRLAIRLNNAMTDFGQHTVRRLLQLAAGDARIVLLLEPMRYDQVLSLYACADIYLSFHRGEGLGLGMLESMALGKAVIATGWSGNLSFMNHSNSALLRYRLVPVSGNYGFFRPEVIGRDARWADPVLEDAVAWMRLLRNNARLRQTLGAKARISAWEYQRKASEAHWLTELEDLWQAQRHLPAVVEKLSHPSNRNSRQAN
ncbi:MAG: hypothetical protein D4R84_11125 [Rhodocyclaceae bacterium]|nr:MAG: hypothetical protein D4R84_11125 [Rhodocyclaceae bacterium]